MGRRGWRRQTETDGRQIIQFQKGTETPIHIHLTGDAFEELFTKTMVPALLSQDTHIMVEEGKLVWLINNSDKFWAQQPILKIWDNLQASLTHEQGPVLDYTLHYNVFYE